MTRKIALIGFGAIAREICRALATDPSVAVTQVLVRPARRDRVAAELPEGISAIASPDDLSPDCDFVLECAGHEAVRQFGPACLRRGVDFGLVSAGALADPETEACLRETAERNARRVVIAPGAIGGIDAIAAAGATLDSVRYASRKAPRSWKGSPAEKTHDLDAIDAPTVLFSGTARQAALSFPKNANVVATVALAGIGFDRTQVTLMADTSATGNTHRIEARSPLFEFDYTTTGAAMPGNPRTSALTALSALRCLKDASPGLRL